MSASDWSELDGHEALVSELRANPPVAPERLRQRVLEGAPAPRRQRSRRRKLVLVVVPAAIVLAVGAALVHGFVSSGKHRGEVLGRALRQNPRVLGPATTTPSAAKKLYPNLHQVAQGKIAKSRENAFSTEQGVQAAGATALSDLAGKSGRAVTIPKNRLVHAVASLQVGVKRSNLSDKTN